MEIILSTFNDGRQAFVFGVNALGVQADGTLNELQSVTSSGSSGTAARATADLSANFVYESKGRVTDFGYEVEVRIPFKSLRYQPRDVQDWGLQLVRKVQHLGHEDTWTPARRDAASFLQQSGRLIGLRDLRRGLVVDLNPSVVAFQTGHRKGQEGWGYLPQGPEYGGTVRWGVTNNLTLNGTVNPDFSQVESDVVAFQYDPRQALFYPERRPFFLEGIENFTVGNNLIYTRRIVQPDVAVKLTGKALRHQPRLLSAYDDRATSITGNGHPMFNILRGTRDLGKQSRIGVTYTDRMDGGDYNRLVGFDGRFIARKIWSLAWQGAVSRTRANDSTGAIAPLWAATHRPAGAPLQLLGAYQRHRRGLRRAGRLPRRVATWWTTSSPTRGLLPPARGRWSRRGASPCGGRGPSHYDAFVNGRASQDRKLHFTSNAAVRGGWRVSGALFFENFGFDKDAVCRLSRRA